jgi:comEA protein
MFDLQKRERFVILFLVVTLLAGIVVLYYKKSSSVIDVKIRSFEAPLSGSGSDRININEADEALLMRLPGVGISLARKIIEYRAASGRFSSTEELKRVSGIKNSLFEKIKDKVSVE